jgi:hypothetical protein
MIHLVQPIVVLAAPSLESGVGCRRRESLVQCARAISFSVVLGLLVISSIGIRDLDAQNTPDFSAQGILARAAAAYSSCKSYRDSGVVKVVFLENGGRRIQEKPFKTAFVRPDRFRFEYAETDFVGATRRYIVWRLGNQVQTWWDIQPGVKEQQSLSSALAGATGVSGGSAHALPALLLPLEVGGRRLTEMTDVKRLADAEVGGVGCLCVEGKYADQRRTVCVDGKTFLVRMIDFQVTFPELSTEQTITYEPVVDEQVAQELLDFDPPAQNDRE